MFGLVGATLVLSYRHAGFVGQASRLRTWLWLVLSLDWPFRFFLKSVWLGTLAVLSAARSSQVLPGYGKMPHQALQPTADRN